MAYTITTDFPSRTEEEIKKRKLRRKTQDVKSFARPAPHTDYQKRLPAMKTGAELRETMGLSEPRVISPKKVSTTQDKPFKPSKALTAANPEQITRVSVAGSKPMTRDTIYSLGQNTVRVHGARGIGRPAKKSTKAKDGRIGGYDVAFDSSVSQEARKAFARQPGAGRATPFRSNYASAAPNKYRVSGPRDSLDAAIRDIMEKGGWKTRLALGKQLLANKGELDVLRKSGLPEERSAKAKRELSTAALNRKEMSMADQYAMYLENQAAAKEAEEDVKEDTDDVIRRLWRRSQ